MANDITTLAIEIQSQEAERNLRTFQELLTLSSQTAHKMEKVSIEIDAGNAISQLQTMREVYEGIAPRWLCSSRFLTDRMPRR